MSDQAQDHCTNVSLPCGQGGWSITNPPQKPADRGKRNGQFHLRCGYYVKKKRNIQQLCESSDPLWKEEKGSDWPGYYKTPEEAEKDGLVCTLEALTV